MSIPDTLAPQLKSAHRRALMATARIACVAALVGCTPKTSSPTDATAATSPPEVTEPATMGECEDTVDTAFADGADAATVGDDVKACCQTLAEAVDADPSKAFVHRGECCSVLNWQGSMACTPWGPPTPPAMVA